MYVNHPEFGRIIDYDHLRKNLRPVYDALYPDFDMLKSMRLGTEIFHDDPNYLVAGGASVLAYMMLIAGEEHELAAKHKDSIFTLGWTEEHTGSDLLSVRTTATPISDEPDERNYHIKGRKWIINNSYFADYHMVIAKIDPNQDGPRSLSLFLVPHSSTKNWKRIEAHVLTGMVLTEYDIDGPGVLVGKPGHGLAIQQRMANPAKYQATYVGVRMVEESIPAALDHLNTKIIFKEHPLNFTNVFRQMYNLVLQGALLHFIFYRSIAFSDTPYMQFYGTMLKSFLLLRANELLSQNLLVAGSKGFVKESVIGRDAIDSFVLPVFDGHYTINTLMTAKHARRYLWGTETATAEDRIAHLRSHLYQSMGDQINAETRAIRNPQFFDYVDYLADFDLPFDLDGNVLINAARDMIDELESSGQSSSSEYKYKTGEMLHWLDSLLAACELWKVTANDHYLNLIIQQYNKVAQFLNTVISEGGLRASFVTLLRQLPLPEFGNGHQFLRGLLDVETQIRALVTA